MKTAFQKPAPASHRTATAKPSAPDSRPSFAGRYTLRVGEVAAALSISKQQVAGLIDEGKLCAINVASGDTSARKCYRIPVEAYRAYIRAADTGSQAGRS